MAGEILQSSFSMGEIAPELRARVDLDAFRKALARCKNFIVGKLGSLMNRTGFRLIPTSTEHVLGDTCLVPFRFSNEQQYVIVLDGSGISGNNGFIYSSGSYVTSFKHPWTSADLKNLRYTQIRDVMFFTARNNTPYELNRNAHDDWTMKPYQTDRTIFAPTIAVGTQSLGSTPATNRDWEWVVTAVNKYGQESLPSARLPVTGTCNEQAQSQFITITPNTVGDDWVEFNIYRGKNGYFGYVGSTDQSGTDAFEDKGGAPAYGDGPPLDKNPFLDPAKIVTTDKSATFVGDTCTKPVGSIAPIDERHTIEYSVRVNDGDTLQLNFYYNVGAGDVLLGSRTHGPTGEWKTEYEYVGGDVGDIPVSTYEEKWQAFTWEVEVPGIVAGDTFKITVAAGAASDLNRSRVSWTEDSGSTEDVWRWPSAVCFFEQRLVFGGFSDEPARIVTSRTGDFRNFDTTDFSQDDESVELLLASGRLDEIYDLIPFRSIIALTNSSEWSIRGGSEGPLTPASFDAKPHTYNGAKLGLRGLPLDGEVFFVTPTGKTIKTLAYSQERDALITRTVNVSGSHLFTSKVKDWAYTENDDAAIVWVVLENGTLLSLTYMPEYEVAAWSQHEINGIVDSVTSVIEDGRAVLYAMIGFPRYYTANGTSVPQTDAITITRLTRLEPRNDNDIRYACHLDGAAVYSGVNDDYTHELTLSNNDATNPSFETGDLTGWTTVASAAPAPIVVYHPADAYDGDYSCFFRTFYTTFGPASGNTTLQQTFTGVIGKDIDISFRFMPITSVTAGARIRIAIDDGSGLYSYVTSVDCSTLAPDTWHEITGTAVATGTAVGVRITLDHTGWSTSKTQDGYVDAVVVNAAGITVQSNLGSLFDSSWVGDRIYLRDATPQVWPLLDISPLDSPSAKDDPIVVEVVSVIDAANVIVNPVIVAESDYGKVTNVWSRARKDFVETGSVPGTSVLYPLQHHDLTVNADGRPGTTHINYAINGGGTVETVTWSIDEHAEVVWVGWPYISEVETLTIPQARDKKKLLSRLHVDVVSARGLKGGPSSDNLDEWFQADPANDPYVLPLETTVVELNIQQKWRKRGGLVVRQENPLPVRIISIGVEVQAGAIA